MKLVQIAIFIGIIFAQYSCTEQLELAPVSSISNSSFWKSEDDAKGALYGMYDRLRVIADDNSIMYWGDGRSEIMGGSFGTGPNIYWENLLSASNPGAGWQSMYPIIHHANLILQNVPGIAFRSEEEKNNIIAQAYTTRAMVYFWITRLWGDAIIVTDPTQSFAPEAIIKERSSVATVFELIKADLDQAISLFSDDGIPDGRFVWSKPSANTLKADVYLWTAKMLGGGDADLNTALAALNEVENADVQLLENYSRVFDYDNKGNNEILFAIRFAEFESGSNWGLNSYMANGYVPSNLDQESTDIIGVLGPGGGDFTISEKVRKQFNVADQRRDGTFREVFTVDDAGQKEFYTAFASKYDGTVSGGARLFVDDIVIYRYADVLLLKAEIKNALGQDPTEEMNEIRMRAYGEQFSDFAFTSGSQAENDDAILQERLFEFTFEGKRWFDLLRFGKVYDLVESMQDKVGQEGLLLFPIGESILSLETKVSQNPGY